MSIMFDPNEKNPQIIAEYRRNIAFGYAADMSKWAGNSFVNTTGDVAQVWFAQSSLDSRVENAGGGTYELSFDGPVPIEVTNALFGWDALKVPTFARINDTDEHPVPVTQADGLGDDGRPYRNVPLSTFAVVRSDTHAELTNGRSGGFTPATNYRESLVARAAQIIDVSAGELGVMAVGNLQGGRKGFISITLNELFETRDGFPIRSVLGLHDAVDGTMAFGAQLDTYATVCMNSLIRNLHDAKKRGEMYKLRHTANAKFSAEEARGVLGMIHASSRDDIAFFEQLAQWEVTNRDFKAVLDVMEPVPEPTITVNDAGKQVVTNQRSITIADGKREGITKMYVNDPRAAPWKDTALGVLQAFNTWDQHERPGVVGHKRFERQQLNRFNGETAKYDADILGNLATVTDFDIEKLMVGAGV